MIVLTMRFKCIFIDINECDGPNNQCPSDSQCTNYDGGYVCCPKGYTGDHCQTGLYKIYSDSSAFQV